MIVKPRGSVTLPRQAKEGIKLFPWCKDVDRALQQLRDRVFYVNASKSGGGGSSPPCPFGKITTYKVGETTKTGILGGIITVAGIDNHEIPNQDINLSVADNEWLVWIELSYVANRDDDNAIFLQGFESSTKPISDWEREPYADEEDSYPSDDPPSLTSGVGMIVLPIGRLKITDGAASLVPAGCGNFTVSHCAGIATYARG
jgi:hypothetical protein